MYRICKERFINQEEFMSIFDDIINAFQVAKESAQEHPCANCPSTCNIFPEACEACKPYKQKLIDALYNVEHRDELLAKYEVVGTNQQSSGAVKCPYCGGMSENPYVCEYCDSVLKEGSGKIQVASASDIPNPILDAQNIIFERFAQVVEKYNKDEISDIFKGVQTKSLLSALIELASGSSDKNSNILGKKMNESEIKEMAEVYGVSIRDYLEGLDNGKYLTKSSKQINDQQQNTLYNSFGTLSAIAPLGAMSYMHHQNHQYHQYPNGRDDIDLSDLFGLSGNSSYNDSSYLQSLFGGSNNTLNNPQSVDFQDLFNLLMGSGTSTHTGGGTNLNIQNNTNSHHSTGNSSHGTSHGTTSSHNTHTTGNSSNSSNVHFHQNSSTVNSSNVRPTHNTHTVNNNSNRPTNENRPIKDVNVPRENTKRENENSGRISSFHQMSEDKKNDRRDSKPSLNKRDSNKEEKASSFSVHKRTDK